jgi:AcrR family transcriptional regulator
VAAIAEKARPLRRDAERNRLLILSAARTVFAQRGLEASLDEIAKEAGLGVGTVYRRFPNREALVDALLTDMIAGIERILDEALAMPRAWDGLTHFMRSLLESQAEDKALRDVLLARKLHEQIDEEVFHERIQVALNDLVARAQQEGDLRPDATATDIGVLEIAAVGIVELTASAGLDVWPRYLSIILDGLRARPTGTTPLVQPALDEHQMDICMTGWKYGSREEPRTRPKPG